MCRKTKIRNDSQCRISLSLTRVCVCVLVPACVKKERLIKVEIYISCPWFSSTLWERWVMFIDVLKYKLPCLYFYLCEDLLTKYIFNLKVKVMTVKQTFEAMRTIQNILAAEYRFYPAYVASTTTHTYTHTHTTEESSRELLWQRNLSVRLSQTEGTCDNGSWGGWAAPAHVWGRSLLSF